MRKRNTIIKTFGNPLTLEQEMAILTSEDQPRLQDVEKETDLELDGAALIQSTDIDSGEVKEILGLFLMDGRMFATISATFIDQFVTINDWLAERGARMTAFKVLEGKSKKGRPFLKCSIAEYKAVS